MHNSVNLSEDHMIGLKELEEILNGRIWVQLLQKYVSDLVLRASFLVHFKKPFCDKVQIALFTLKEA